MRKLAALILAAGEGTRLNEGRPSKKAKVLYEVNGKSMLDYSLEVLSSLSIKEVVIVVGHLGEKVKKHVGDIYKYAFQEKSTGTGEAVRIGLESVSIPAEDVLVLYGADIYQQDIVRGLIKEHFQSGSVITFLTAYRENPKGLGRIVRDKKGKLKAIVEEKLATEEEKKIQEVNDGAYIFDRDFLEREIKNLRLTKINEYFLTDLIEIAIKGKQKVTALKTQGESWFGVDTPEQLTATTEWVKNNWPKKL